MKIKLWAKPFDKIHYGPVVFRMDDPVIDKNWSQSERPRYDTAWRYNKAFIIPPWFL